MGLQFIKLALKKPGKFHLLASVIWREGWLLQLRVGIGLGLGLGTRDIGLGLGTRG